MENRIKLAEIEGYSLDPVKQGGVIYNFALNGVGKNSIPTYESRDDLQRIIDGMDKLTLGMYWDALVYIFNRDRDSYSYFELLTATVEQIQEAILRACGKWDEPKGTEGSE